MPRLLLAVDRLFWAAVAVVSGTLAASLYTQDVGWAPGALLAVVALAALLRPFEALLLLAGLGPIAAVIFIVLRAANQHLRFEEALALAFVAGYAVRRVFVRLPASADWRYAAAIVFAVLVAASGTVAVAMLIAEEPGFTAFEQLRGFAAERYLFEINPVSATGLMLGGVAAMLAAREICNGRAARRDAVARMIAVGAAAAAAFNLVRLVAVSLSRPEPFAAFASLLPSLRVNVHHGDLNAAGSAFALALFVALGVARRSPWVGGPCAALIAAGLWMSGSRSALAACVIAGGGWWMWRAAHAGARRWRTAAAGLAVVALVGVAAWLYYPSERNAAWSLAWQVRRSLARGAVDMTVSAPVFGVGMGRYHQLSGNYTIDPHTGPRENAHNNFLQILAELGIPGLLLFLTIIGAHLARSWHEGQRSALAAGILAGSFAYLLTCIVGHPLLVPAAAYPFWLTVGLAAATSSGSTEVRAGAGASWAMIALLAGAIAVGAGTPKRARAAMETVDLTNTTVGFSGIRHDESGIPFRYAGGRAFFFAPADAASVRVSIRRGIPAEGELEARVAVDGREVTRLPIVHFGADWQNVDVVLPKPAPGRFHRVELQAFFNGHPAVGLQADQTGPLRVMRPKLSFQPVVDVMASSTGFTGWRSDENSTPFRYAGGRAVFSAPADATAVRISMRRGESAGGAVDARVLVDGKEAGLVQILPFGADWQSMTVALPKPPSQPSYRIELQTFIDGRLAADARSDDDTGVLRVARPELLYPSPVSR